MTNSRENIYYWKCDRPSAFYAIDCASTTPDTKTNLQPRVGQLIADTFGAGYTIVPACGQGNHQTYLASRGADTYFVRLENGPEKDDYMEVEAHVIACVRGVGVPTPQIFAVDSSRRKYPFAYQIMENLHDEDLNRLYRRGELDIDRIMRTVGRYIAQWQTITPDGFGPFNSDTLRDSGVLVGLHATYRDYYTLNLERHLHFLTDRNFLTTTFANALREAIARHDELLDIKQGCLVHKDLALWNLIGTRDSVSSVIDWDDSVSGDAVDDLSLMGCFHSWTELRPLFEGYAEVKALPADFEPRFWLHLLRNMLFKAVIRVGAGYFDKSGDFFLTNDGADLRGFTSARIEAAYEGLNGNCKIDEL